MSASALVAALGVAAVLHTLEVGHNVFDERGEEGAAGVTFALALTEPRQAGGGGAARTLDPARLAASNELRIAEAHFGAAE